MHAPRWILVTALALAPSIGIATTAHAAQRPAKEDAAEWAEAWGSLTDAERATLTQAWTNAVDKAKSLTPEQKAKIKSAVVSFTEALVAAVQNMTPEQKEQLAAKLKDLRQAYRALTTEQKRDFMKKLAHGLDAAKVRRANRKAFRDALKGAMN
jgi:hypothetical protein